MCHLWNIGLRSFVAIEMSIIFYDELQVRVTQLLNKYTFFYVIAMFALITVSCNSQRNYN